ncbi:site-specific DNA-methyltransferase [Candidatus Gracilibacteria bacterium]|nr:site-specific DNA-methyltransferase [Candidatus Gracilibacteria bacterium]
MPKFNDFDLSGENWKKYEDILTDSLWVINERDKSGKHSNFYHGNFIPQIPNQLIKRYTKKGDYVLDLFLGSGTTAIECEKLERNIIGVDIKEELVNRAKELITSDKIKKEFLLGNSGSKLTQNRIKTYLTLQNRKGADLVLLHPPYFDIIKFSDKKQDLSNAPNITEFLKMFNKVLQNSFNLLKGGGYMGIIIGDKYQNSEWIPLGFQCMAEAQKVGFKLKSIIIKNMEGNRGKAGTGGIWRYRALNIFNKFNLIYE